MIKRVNRVKIIIILLLLVHALCLARFTVQLDTTYTHTVLWSVVLLYIYSLVQSLFTLGLCTQLHCTTVHSLVPAWPLFCQPITEELRFTCFALIGPLGVTRTWSWSLITACWPRPFPREMDVVKICWIWSYLPTHPLPVPIGIKLYLSVLIHFNSVAWTLKLNLCTHTVGLMQIYFNFNQW